MDQGRDALQRLMRKQNLPFKRLANEEVLTQVAVDEMKFPDLEALYVAVGEGHVSPQSVVARLARLLSGTPEDDVTEVPLARPVRLGKQAEVGQGVMVRGLPDVWVRLGPVLHAGARATRSWGSSRGGRASPSIAPTARTRRRCSGSPSG